MRPLQDTRPCGVCPQTARRTVRRCLEPSGPGTSGIAVYWSRVSSQSHGTVRAEERLRRSRGVHVPASSRTDGRRRSDAWRVADEKARILRSLRESLDIYEGSEGGPARTGRETDREEGSLTLFLVHGRDAGAREVVRRFLEKVCDAPVIVLADQPSKGLTIVEKLENHLGGATFVVVLLTGDDEGRLRGETDMTLRARQNVIFELGYAVGSLERTNVAVLFEDGVELPSDFYGVGYIAFDQSGGWRLQLVAELKAAGIAADANRAVE
jgi:hypothetical protein